MSTARVVRVPENLGSITFIESDLRDFDRTPFDLVAPLGVFYRLDINYQVALIEHCRRQGLHHRLPGGLLLNR